VLAKGANVLNAHVATLADSLAQTGPVARQFRGVARRHRGGAGEARRQRAGREHRRHRAAAGADPAANPDRGGAERAAKTALVAFHALARANPFVQIATGVGAAVSALIAFNSTTSSFLANQEKQRDLAADVNALYERQAKLLADVAGRGSQFATVKGPQEQFAEAFAELQKLGLELEKLRGQKIDANLLLDTKALVGSSTAIEGVREAVLSIGAAFDAAGQSSKATIDSLKSVQGSNLGAGLRGIFFPDDVREERGAQAFANRIEQLRTFLRPFGIELDENRRAFVDYEKALQIVSQAFADLEKRAGDAGVALGKTGASSTAELSSAVKALVAEREKELRISLLTGAEREKALLVAEAEKRAGQGLNDLEKQRLSALAQAIVDTQKLLEAQRKQANEAEKAAQVQRDLPQNLAELQKRYQDQLQLAQATGVERELIRAEIEAENDAKEIGLDLSSKEFAQLRELAIERARLTSEERGQRRSERTDRRRDEAFRDLEAQEELLKRVGAEREKYRLQIEAENEARQAGLSIGSAEFQDYVRRRVAVQRFAEESERLVGLFVSFGEAGSSALERLIIDMERGRDVAKACWQDLQRLALRQTAGASTQQLFALAGQSLAGLFAPGPTAPQSGPNSPTGRAGLVNQSSINGGKNYLSGGFMTGGVIPAMSGQVVDEFWFLRRGNRTYSLAEGGKSTPEAIVPLERMQDGRLGVASGGGGGGTTINMAFPGVRTARDARAMRATIGQQVRQLRGADRRGWRGLRPAGQ
jgi:hypothetical protein